MTRYRSCLKGPSSVPPLALQIQVNHGGIWTGFTEGYARLLSLKVSTKIRVLMLPLLWAPPILSNLYSLQPFKHRNFKLPSTGRGPPAPQTVEAMVKCNETDFINRHTYHAPLRQNISPTECKALSDLRNNTHIVIKPADKGGSLVIQNRTHYLTQG